MTGYAASTRGFATLTAPQRKALDSIASGEPTEEVWRPVVGYEAIYSVSDQGRVRRVAPLPGKPVTGQPLIARTAKTGYPRVNLARRTHSVHVLVCEAFHGPRPAGCEVRHLDGSRSNNNAANLAWGTSAENKRDCVRHGTHPETLKTHCPRGHQLVAPNLVEAVLRKTGHRKCRACYQGHSLVRQATRRGESLTVDEAAATAYERLGIAS